MYVSISNRIRVLLAVVVGLLLVVMPLAGSVPITVAQSETTVTFEVQGQARVGQPVIVRLVARGARDLAGFQALVGFDASQLRLTSASIERSGLNRGNREVFPLGPALIQPLTTDGEDEVVAGPSAVALGAATCPVKTCSDRNRDKASRDPNGVNGRVELGRVEFYTEVAGRYDLTLADLVLVDPAGNRLPVAASNLVLEIGSAGQPGAPAREQATIVQPVATAPGSVHSRDLSGNGIIDDADATLLADRWRLLRQDGQCLADVLATSDLDGSGCLDVADVQLVLAAWGESAPLSSALDTATPDGITPQDDEVTTLDEATPEASLSGTSRSLAQVDGSYVVTSSADDGDADLTDGLCATTSGVCTFRAATQQATARPGPDTITFNIRNADGSCASLVTLTPATGFILDDKQGPTTIDGYSQCGASPNTDAVSGNAVIKIELKGSNTFYVDGLTLLSAGNVVRGLAIYNWDHQLIISGRAASRNVVQGNFLGTNAANSFSQVRPTQQQHAQGLIVKAPDNQIGGSTPAARNIISGNGLDGLELNLDDTANNVIQGNYIGLKQNGTVALANKSDGIDINLGAHHNTVGGTAPGERNVVSGNTSQGIEISHNPSLVAQANQIIGNYWGLNASGTAAVPNNDDGISLEDAVDSNRIEDNLISGNRDSGLRFYVLGANNQITGNRIGVAADGVTPIPNGGGSSSTPSSRPHGIYLFGGPQSNRIADNLIAHNVGAGIYLSNNSDDNHNGFGQTYFNTISQNRIYANQQDGIHFYCKVNPQTGVRDCPNQNLKAPTLTSVSTTTASGTVCGGCTVEVFLADKTQVPDASGDNNGEGKTVVGTGVATSGGTFTVALQGVNPGAVLTATATDSLGNTSEFATNVLVPDTTPPDPPVPSPAGGTYTGSQSVTLTAEAGATIRYTTDGSTPSVTSGTIYSGPISISSTTTLKAVAIDSAGNVSTVMTETYTIEATAPVTAAPAPPSELSIIKGSIVSGSVSQLAADDGAYVVVGSAAAGSTQVIAFYGQYTVPLDQRSLVGLSVSYDGGASVGNFTRQLSLFNFQTGAWEVLKSETQPTTDLMTTITVSDNAARFMSSTGLIRLRVQATRSQSFELKADAMSFTITYQP